MSRYESTRSNKSTISNTKRQDEALEDVDIDVANTDNDWKLPDDVSVDSGDVSCLTAGETNTSQRALKSFEGSLNVDELKHDVERGRPTYSSPRVLGGRRTRMDSKATKSTHSSLTMHFVSNPRRRRLFLWATLAFALLVGVVVTLVLLVGQHGNKKKNSTPTDPKAETDAYVLLSPREEALIEILNQVSPIGFDDKESPQFKAKEWLLHNDSMQLTPSATTTNERIVQRYALAVFFYATDGPNSWSKNNWLIGDECSNQFWTGMSCDDDKKIRAIAFDNDGLQGHIPEEIGVFLMLENLVIKNHDKMTGQIPTSIGNLQVLGQLGLYSNALTGGIPNELYSATSLNYINLQNNQLTGGIMLGIEKLRNLEKLILFNNKFNGAVPFRQMAKTGMRFLGLSNNEFQGTIPEQISNLPNLEYLYLNNNNFTGTLTPSYGRLLNLVSMNLDANAFSGSIPSEIGKALSLSFLSMQKNRLTGTIPTQINQLRKLRTFNAATNRITGPIPPTEKMGSLVNLYLYQNQLTGTLPSTLGVMASLQVVFLSSNRLNGSINNMLSNTTKTFQGLYLSDNVLEGTIPDSLCAIGSLQALFLDTNNLTGELPSCLGSLTSLRQLYAFQNQLSGEVPESFVSLQSLRGLGLENNHLVGDIPSGICQIQPLTDIWSDCGGQSPEIVCTCCTTCCPSATCNGNLV